MSSLLPSRLSSKPASLRLPARRVLIRRYPLRRVLHFESKASQKQPGRRSNTTTRVETNDWDPQSYNTPPPPPPPRVPPHRTDYTSQLEPESPGLSNFTNAIVVGAFILGIGAGVYFTSDVGSKVFDLLSEL